MTDQPTRAERAIERRRRELREAELKQAVRTAKDQLRAALKADDMNAATEAVEQWEAAVVNLESVTDGGNDAPTE